RDPVAALTKADDTGELTWEKSAAPREVASREAMRGEGLRGEPRPRPPWPFSELERELRAALSESDYPEIQVRPWRPRRPQAGLDIGPGLSIVIPWQTGPQHGPPGPGPGPQQGPERHDDMQQGEIRLPPIFAVWLRDAGGQWYSVKPRQAEPLVPRWLFTTLWLLTTAAIIAGLTLWTTVRLLRPLRAMADTARDWQAEAPPRHLPETGPMEFRAIAQAMNAMQGRIHRFVRDRAALVAALSHDLRTPLTRLRLRLESPESPERRQRMQDDIDFMQRLTEQLLGFSALDARGEPEQRVDIAVLLASLCDDASDAGSDAVYDGPVHVVTVCRPTAMKRALMNLIDNAIKYGSLARVGLTLQGDSVAIRVRDAGPGIPAAEFENVLAPFYRLDTARGQETGGQGAGLGMGLAVAASILRAHGGSLAFAHPPEGGFEAIAMLPLRR
ncbi:MAG: ATP-binding protein, partial [Ferrovibrio sp.]|nr:ATP-binding protein [Ferrovibrio sp.]